MIAAARPAPDAPTLRAARRRLLVDMLGIVASAAGFGVVFGLTARANGFSPLEAMAFSVLVFAGASQFAAAGMVGAGFGWPAIVVLTGLVNARHLLYAAALGPWLRDRSRVERALMAHVLTDEAFALSLVHFRRLGFADRRGYWLAAIGGVFIPWNLATLVGVLGGRSCPTRGSSGSTSSSRRRWPGLPWALRRGGGRSPPALPGWASPSSSASRSIPRAGVLAGGLLGPGVGLLVPRRDPAVPEPDELPAEPGSFRRPDRSDDGIAP